MANTYKAQKEAFVSNLSGGSLLEIILVTLVAPAAAFLYSALQSRLSFFTPYGPIQLIADFLLNVAAILFATTAYSSAPLLLNVLLVSPAIILFLLPSQHEPSKKSSQQNGPAPSTSSPTTTANSATTLPIRPFLTLYRGSMLIVTCTSILAVDFRIFPRRFAKVENWGTSLMDVGVGSFVFSAGLVSARAALNSTHSLKANRPSSLHQIASSIRHSLPLLALGLIRLLSVKNLDYAEHVSEYGVHWNFFFTLALLGPFVALFDHLPVPYEATALLLATVYEIILNSTDLIAFILTAPRTDLLSQNREGVCSFIGYLAIFLAGRGTGVAVLAPPEKKPATKAAGKQQQLQKERTALLQSLLSRALAWSVLSISATSYRGGNLPVSRRMANLPYVLWVVGFNNAQVLLFALIEAACFGAEPQPAGQSEIMQAFNSNGLVVFLVANLLTGLVNLSVDTLGTSGLAAMGMLIGYAGCVTGFAVAMRRWGVRIKM